MKMIEGIAKFLIGLMEKANYLNSPNKCLNIAHFILVLFFDYFDNQSKTLSNLNKPTIALIITHQLLCMRKLHYILQETVLNEIQNGFHRLR